MALVIRVTAVARSNIALCKYWGKADEERNLPAVPSLSMTVEGLRTRTTVGLMEEAGEDRIWIDGRPASPQARRRVVEHLDRLRARAGVRPHLEVVSENDFPTGAGLASSASAFAALTAGAARVLGLSLTLDDLSDLARRASASAARSLHGGFVELPAGAPGTEFLAARPVPASAQLAVRLLVLVTTESPKRVGSRDGMNHTTRTSPYHEAFVRQAPEELAAARAAIEQGDFTLLGTIAERSALRMHADALAGAPGLLYWNGTTVEAMAAVGRLRERGIEAYFTIDAGPHVKVLCRASDAGRVRDALASLRGVLRVLESGVGGPVEVGPA